MTRTAAELIKERNRLKAKLKNGLYTTNDLRRNQHSFDMRMVRELEDQLEALGVKL